MEPVHTLMEKFRPVVLEKSDFEYREKNRFSVLGPGPIVGTRERRVVEKSLVFSFCES